MPNKNIYKSGQSLHGEVYIHFLKKHFALFRGMALGLMFWGVLGLYSVYSPIIREEANYQFNRLKYSLRQDKLATEAKSIAEVQANAAKWGVNSSFSVVIPKIEASKNIVANVDTANQYEYTQALKEGIAHAKGTYFPGQGNNVFLFAHSTDTEFNVLQYNATFYLLNKLEQGDDVFVYFGDKQFRYKVDFAKIVEATDTSWLKPTDSERLTLQTCYPPGTTLKRLIVTAKPV